MVRTWTGSSSRKLCPREAGLRAEVKEDGPEGGSEEGRKQEPLLRGSARPGQSGGGGGCGAGTGECLFPSPLRRGPSSQGRPLNPFLPTPPAPPPPSVRPLPSNAPSEQPVSWLLPFLQSHAHVTVTSSPDLHPSCRVLEGKDLSGFSLPSNSLDCRILRAGTASFSPQCLHPPLYYAVGSSGAETSSSLFGDQDLLPHLTPTL